MKYDKEFIDLCADWIRGNVQDKSKFNKYKELMEENSIKTTGFRIWDFEPKEIKNVVFFQGDLEIEQNPIESCFTLDDLVDPFSEKQQHIDLNDIESINKMLCMYLAESKIITRWANDKHFDVYEPLKYGIEEFKNCNDEFTKEDFDRYNKLINFYSHQKEMLNLGEHNNICSNEVIYVMLSKHSFEEYYNDNEDLQNILYYEMEDYFLFYNDEKFRNIVKQDKNLIMEFQSISELLGRSF